MRGAVEAAWDEPDPLALAAAVLPLVAAAGLRPGDLPWLATLPLPDADGEAAQADELVLPGSVLAGLADPDEVGVVAAELVDRWGGEVLAAVGVLDTFTVIEVEDVVLDETAADERLADWVAAVLDGQPRSPVPPTARSVLVVPDLDLVADDRWPDALRVLSADPRLREAVVTPVRLSGGDGRSASVPSYAGWVLRSNALLGGRPATSWALPGVGLDGLYDVLGAELLDGIDPAVLAAAGVRAGLADVLAADGGAGRPARPARRRGPHGVGQDAGRGLVAARAGRPGPGVTAGPAAPRPGPGRAGGGRGGGRRARAPPGAGRGPRAGGAARRGRAAGGGARPGPQLGRRRQHPTCPAGQPRRCPTAWPVSSTGCPRPGRSTTT